MQITQGSLLLHWQYVSQLLNDMFGVQVRDAAISCAAVDTISCSVYLIVALVINRIKMLLLQCRGGCMCAGPFAIDLLGMSPAQTGMLEAQLLAKDEMVRDGAGL
jgi:hypothetical protein